MVLSYKTIININGSQNIATATDIYSGTTLVIYRLKINLAFCLRYLFWYLFECVTKTEMRKSKYMSNVL